jgi:hypothetical protein
LEGCNDDKDSILGVSDAQFKRRMMDTIDLWDDAIANLPFLELHIYIACYLY